VIDVLVLSHACNTAINRAPYRVLAERGWAIEIVTARRLETSGFAREADPAQPNDPPLHVLPFVGSNGRVWRFEGLGEVLDARRPRILMLEYDPGTLLAIQSGVWALRNGAHVVCLSYDNMLRTVSGEMSRSIGAGARTATVRVASAAATRLVDHVFVLSDDGIAVMEDLGFAGRASKIPLGFDPEVFFPDPDARTRVRRELGLTNVVFAYFGRIIPEKGVHVLLHALNKLRDRPWHLLLDEFKEYGHPYAEELKRLIAELGLTDRVVYFDAPHEKVAEYMNAADVVVVPSVSNDRWKEQYGRVAPEAMACGRLVVVSSSGALKELVGEAGIVVPENDAAALSATLGSLIDDEARRADYGRRACERAHELLSLPAQADRMEELFRRWTEPSAPASLPTPHASSCLNAS
jgi:glycosyltransferase involved in cell wall biosynthesis